MILKSPAKINLYLEVLNKRKDGFHNINTVFEKIALYDLISLKKREKGIKINFSGEKIPRGHKNLAYKAAHLLQEETGIKKGVEIKIKKNIPVGAGLGGGSSNAAIVLLGLNRLWRLGLSESKLGKLGSKIGADVPFFLTKSAWAIGRGKGEILKPLNSSLKLWHMIVVPKERISTKDSYQKLSLRLTKDRILHKIMTYAIIQGQFNLLKKALFNRLEDSLVVAKCPSVKKIKGIFTQMGLKALMSGSGSAVFTLFSKREEALGVKRILSVYPWKILVVKTWVKTS